MMARWPEYGINRRSLIRIFKTLGGRVEYVRRTGEIRLTHPILGTSGKANGRRRDAPRELVQFVQNVWRLQGGRMTLW